MTELNCKSEVEALEQLKKTHFEQTGKELSEQEAEDIRFVAQMFAEIAYESWAGEKKKFIHSKKTVPKRP